MTTRCARWCPRTTCSSAALLKPLRSVAVRRGGDAYVCRNELNQASNFEVDSVPCDVGRMSVGDGVIDAPWTRVAEARVGHK